MEGVESLLQEEGRGRSVMSVCLVVGLRHGVWFTGYERYSTRQSSGLLQDLQASRKSRDPRKLLLLSYITCLGHSQDGKAPMIRLATHVSTLVAIPVVDLSEKPVLLTRRQTTFEEVEKRERTGPFFFAFLLFWAYPDPPSILEAGSSDSRLHPAAVPNFCVYLRV